MRFDTTLSQMGNNTGIEVPAEVLDALGGGGGKRAAVVVEVNGFTYRSTIGSMGGKSLIPFSSDKRASTVCPEGMPSPSTSPSTPRPARSRCPMTSPQPSPRPVRAMPFDALSPSARKAHVTNVEAAKATDTRSRRIDAIVAKLS